MNLGMNKGLAIPFGATALCIIQKDIEIFGWRFKAGSVLVNKNIYAKTEEYCFLRKAPDNNNPLDQYNNEYVPIDLGHLQEVISEKITIESIIADINRVNSGSGELVYATLIEDKPVTPVIFHGIIQGMHAEINEKKYLLECLQKRLVVIHTDYELKSEHEKNEIEIIKMQTRDEIAELQMQIKRRESYFTHYFQTFIADIEKAKVELPELIAVTKDIDNEEVNKLLAAINLDCLESTAENSIKLNKLLKNSI